MREPIFVPDPDCDTLVLSVRYVKPGEITAPAAGVLSERCAIAGEQLSAG